MHLGTALLDEDDELRSTLPNPWFFFERKHELILIRCRVTICFSDPIKPSGKASAQKFARLDSKVSFAQK